MRRVELVVDPFDLTVVEARVGRRRGRARGAAQDEILRVILAVSSGEAIFGPVVSRFDYFFREPPGRTDELSRRSLIRKRQVLELIAQVRPIQRSAPHTTILGR